MIIQGLLSHGTHLCFRAFVQPPWAEIHRVYFTKERQATERREKSKRAEAAEVEAEEAAVVSKEVASGKTKRRDGDEEGILYISIPILTASLYSIIEKYMVVLE